MFTVYLYMFSFLCCIQEINCNLNTSRRHILPLTLAGRPSSRKGLTGEAVTASPDEQTAQTFGCVGRLTPLNLFTGASGVNDGRQTPNKALCRVCVCMMCAQTPFARQQRAISRAHYNDRCIGLTWGVCVSAYVCVCVQVVPSVWH